MNSERITSLLENQTAIAVTDPSYQGILGDLQPNIISSHGRRHSNLLFVRFEDSDNGRLKAKYLLGMLARSSVERAVFSSGVRDPAVQDMLPSTIRAILSAGEMPGRPGGGGEGPFAGVKGLRLASELTIRREREASWAAAPAPVRKRPDDVILNVLLSNTGYIKLGEVLPDDPAFCEGMAARGPKLLCDSVTWDHGYVDALIILSHEGRQAAAVEACRQLISAYATLVREDKGAALTASNGEEGKARKTWFIEPFGYRDGISQPTFYDSDRTRALGGLAAGVGPKAWDPFAPLKLALSPDPHGRRELSCGSYFVFRKLQQDLGKFRRQAAAVGDATKRQIDEIEDELIGRHRDGTPLAGADPIDFNYLDDPLAARCPFHSHMRKTNPRGDIPAIYQPRDHRIVRRALPYSDGAEVKRDVDGRPILDGERESKADVGLLFLCAQSSIATQFEHIQASWANDSTFPPGRGPGADPLVGQLGPGEKNYLAVRYRDPASGQLYSKGRDTEWSSPVTLVGGAYFFAPSISFLRGLSDDLWSNS